jgi:hypothetical protein
MLFYYANYLPRKLDLASGNDDLVDSRAAAWMGRGKLRRLVAGDFRASGLLDGLTGDK